MIGCPQVRKAVPGMWTIRDPTDVVFQAGQFPGFSVRPLVRQGMLQDLGQGSASPDPGHQLAGKAQRRRDLITNATQLWKCASVVGERSTMAFVSRSGRRRGLQAPPISGGLAGRRKRSRSLELRWGFRHESEIRK